MYLFKRGLLPNYSYIRIILEIATFFTYLPVELISETSQFGFKELCFLTRQVLKFKTVKTSVCLPKDLKKSFFLSHIYSLLSYILLLSSSFLFLLFFKIIHSIFYAVPIICVMYPMLSGSL